jgi:hypothetical protein
MVSFVCIYGRLDFVHQRCDSLELDPFETCRGVLVMFAVPVPVIEPDDWFVLVGMAVVSPVVDILGIGVGFRYAADVDTFDGSTGVFERVVVDDFVSVPIGSSRPPIGHCSVPQWNKRCATRR